MTYGNINICIWKLFSGSHLTWKLDRYTWNIPDFKYNNIGSVLLILVLIKCLSIIKCILYFILLYDHHKLQNLFKN